jgi:NAD(P)-dependent dehydrogenase (short-subunit alcohol dehydrogenase family)
MPKLCEGRVAIVTGGGRGIGREHCLMLAAHGARIVVNDLGATADGGGNDIAPAQQVVEEIRAAGGEAIVNGADVSDWNAAKEMIEAAVSAFGRLDILVNNAGILRDKMMVNMSEADWDQVIQVHLKGTFAPSHHAANHWRDRSKQLGAPVKARLINTSSTSGIYGRNVGQANYGAAKAGIAAFTIITARELHRYGVTVNAVAPGALTRLTENLGKITDEMRENLSPRWIAPLITWLASEQSDEVTGQVFEVVGDMVAVAEGWRRGPTGKGDLDPERLAALIPDLVAQAAPPQA